MIESVAVPLSFIDPTPFIALSWAASVLVLGALIAYALLDRPSGD